MKRWNPSFAAVLAIALMWGGVACAQPSKKPRVPAGRDPGGIAVGIIGGGVNYTLPQIAQRLARDGEGELIGWDFVDNDQRPLEPPGGTGGTALASIVLREAGAARLAVVRDKAGDGLARAKAAVLLARSPVRIALLVSVGAERAEWEPFAQAATHFPNMLFVVPAGDEGRDLEREPLFPVSLGLTNVLVVAGIDGAGQPFARANRGSRTIDVAVPAEAVEAYGSDGAKVVLAGSAAAAARVTAMAARVAVVEPNLAGAALKQRILSYAKPLPGGIGFATRSGWIANVGRINLLE